MTENYKKLNPITHILHRPDMYIGTIQSSIENLFLYENDKLEFQKSQPINEGILRVFTEVVSNAIDNYFRSKDKTEMTKLIIKYDETTNKMEVYNDGNHIPVLLHEEENIYIPELVFGHLLSGSNYNDNHDRIVSGRNGLGIKLLNVFSKKFSIECFDIDRGLVYKQSWFDNMRKKGKPKLLEKKKDSHVSGYTKISFELDFSKFKDVHNQIMNESCFDTTTIAMMKKLLVDASMIMNIPVYFNKEKFHVKRLIDYAKFFNNFERKEVIEGRFDNMNFEYCILPFQSLEHITFVNGIYTKDGGVHVDLFSQKFFSLLLPKLKKYDVQMKDLKKYFTFVLKLFVSNPVFSSQSKTKLVSSKSAMKIEFDAKIINKVLKWEFMNQIRSTFEMKQELSMKGQEKKRGFKTISSYERANLSSTKRSHECTLILTEGLSAKCFAVKALQKGIRGGKKGREYFGVYPLKGKLLNVMNANASAIINNKEITDIIQILNLKYNTDYTNEKNFAQLSYGKIMILTDSDVDGKHICALIINLFHKLFPSLLQRESDFLQLCMTPIAKMKISGETTTYYSDYEYKKKLQEVEQQGKKIQFVKYYKGLGTSTDEEASFGDKILNLKYTGKETDECMIKVFHKLSTHERKKWMLHFNEENYKEPLDTVYEIPSFMDQELILYSLDDTGRSIASMVDGLKTSMRKILFSCFKKKLLQPSSQIKVAQLSGFVSENTNYHHGEECLNGTIIKMAQSFTGSNNVPLLENIGQFGSRTVNGKDAASPRYIFTRLNSLTPLVYREEDEHLLNFAYDDGDRVEYEMYCPIIPMILVNGSNSIATGWSSTILCYNLLDIVDKLKLLLYNRQEEFQNKKLIPFYEKFKGTIHEFEENKYYSYGIYEKKQNKNKQIICIREIPIGESIDNYRSFLETKLEKKEIKNLSNYSSADFCHFEFEVESIHEDTFMEDFKLKSILSTTNMVLFDAEKKIKRYESVNEILFDFYNFRLEFYKKRKESNIRELQHKKKIMENKARFIHEILEKKIKVFEKEEKDVIELLAQRNFDKVEHSFDYLLTMTIKTMTKEKYEKLKLDIEVLEKEIILLSETPVKDIWRNELKILETEYKKKMEL